ncbi:unnamed protein product [Didymodactylos carnosus]|nr:unnamed protein product [Didymodactylos carnosus]CAF3813641.1 unnamed protein product [Didymodactylos carnosus]
MKCQCIDNMIICDNVKNLTLIDLNRILLTDSRFITDFYVTNNNIQNLNIPLKVKISKKLIRVNYSSNMIRTIDDRYFEQMSSLELLNLDYNQLESSSIRSFKWLKSLKYLYLKQAFHWSITGPNNQQLNDFLNILKFLSNASYLPYLEELHLESNNLKIIDIIWSKIDLHCLFPTLKMLFLTNNNFNDAIFQTSCQTQIIMISLVSNKIHALSYNSIQSLEWLKMNK